MTTDSKEPRLIDRLALPSDLRQLEVFELRKVAEELREELIQNMSDLSGHFASSLGVTELSVALHSVYSTPQDRLVWDVGHQGYIHKMLTGRRSQMSSIRKQGGISGFLRRDESEFDTFGAGHAGTSISAAVGMAQALQKQGSEQKVAAIIGDASISSGMALEALNHAGSLGLGNLVVVLNDNEMSISPNVGALSWLFSKAITSKTSTVARRQFKNLHRAGYVPDIVYKAIDRAEEAAQGFFAGAAMLFEAFGFRYIGPIDGHDMSDLIPALEAAKQQDVPTLVHCYTVKGKGYEPAEEDPLTWHAVKPFDPKAGRFLSKKDAKPSPPTYTSVFADELIEIAKKDKSVVGITAAMSTGTGLDRFEKELPQQFFDVGICEQHAVTFAAGLACEGFTPVCAIYSTFLQRAYDQIVHDVCIQKLPIVFAIDRAGAVGNDGETHQGAFDISYLRSIPNMVLLAPRDENELRRMLRFAVKLGQPVAVRFPRGSGEGVDTGSVRTGNIQLGKGEVLRKGRDAALLALGPVCNRALEVAEQLQLEHGISLEIVDMQFAKPLDLELIESVAKRHSILFTAEDHSLAGGFGSAVLEALAERDLLGNLKCQRFGMTDDFTLHASQQEQYEVHGYDANSMKQAFLRALSSSDASKFQAA